MGVDSMLSDARRDGGCVFQSQKKSKQSECACEPAPLERMKSNRAECRKG